MAVTQTLTFVFMLMTLASCTTVTTHKSSGEEITMTHEEFAKYVEHVFRYHNQIMAELIESAADREDITSKSYQDLTRAEKQMVTLCEPLNEVVTESLSGENIGFTLKMKLVEAAPACESATQQVDKLLGD
jgi:hypothetical protein